eukprot:1063-Amphidinium_carterae.1
MEVHLWFSRTARRRKQVPRLHDAVQGISRRLLRAKIREEKEHLKKSGMEDNQSTKHSHTSRRMSNDDQGHQRREQAGQLGLLRRACNTLTQSSWPTSWSSQLLGLALNVNQCPPWGQCDKVVLQPSCWVCNMSSRIHRLHPAASVRGNGRLCRLSFLSEGCKPPRARGPQVEAVCDVMIASTSKPTQLEHCSMQPSCLPLVSAGQPSPASRFFKQVVILGPPETPPKINNQ